MEKFQLNPDNTKTLFVTPKWYLTNQQTLTKQCHYCNNSFSMSLYKDEFVYMILTKKGKFNVVTKSQKSLRKMCAPCVLVRMGKSKLDAFVTS